MGTLYLTRHPGITDEGVAHLRDLTSLEKLILFDTRLTDAGIDSLLSMKRLRRLDIDGTLVSDAGLVKLRALPRLKDLSIQRSQATLAGADALKKYLPNVKVQFSYSKPPH